MCGILGIYNLIESKLIRNTLFHLKKLQNRGRDSYGVFFNSFEKKEHIILKKEGDINFEEIDIDYDVHYDIALGYTRYATSYKNAIDDKIFYTQPFIGENINLGKFVLIHNGNLDLIKLRKFFNLEDKKYDHFNDSQILVSIISEMDIDNWKDLLIEILNKIDFAYSLIIYEFKNNSMYLVKDRFGVKPLSIAENKNGYCIASENSVLSNYNYIKELDSNSIYRISKKNGFIEIYKKQSINKLCLFEYIYFKNKETKVYGGISNTIEYEEPYGYNLLKSVSLENFRESMGIQFAKEEISMSYFNTYKNAVVIGAPSTGIPYGIGFAKQLKAEYIQFIEKVKNEKRSFILNTDKDRLEQIKRKFKINEEYNIKDKVVYFVDDSLVRGNTIGVIIKLLKQYKPKEIHIRIASPKILYSCYYGIDIPTREELIMNKYNEKKFAKKHKINSLRFLELKDYNHVLNLLNKNVNNFCTSCMTGKYLDLYDF